MVWKLGRRETLAGIGGGLLLGGNVRAEAPKSGGTLNAGLVNDAKTYDPIFSVQFTERHVLYLVFNTLVKYAPDFSIQPELANELGNLRRRQADRLHLAAGRDIP